MGSSNADTPAWTRLFQDGDFRFSFGVRSVDAPSFFAPTDLNSELLSERRRWLENHPDRHLLMNPVAVPLVEEVCQLAKEWGTVATAPNDLRCLGEQWEPDIVLLNENDTGQFVMHAGVVSFPSAWAPETKLGKSVHEIHAPVPTLNRDLGGRIDKFLGNIKPGAVWERNNWGLSRSSERNQHPALDTPVLVPPFTAEESWVRNEDQVLVRLPETGGLLFGIRIVNISLAEVKQYPETAAGLRHAIATMPEEVADYKNVTSAREYLLALLAID